MKRVLILVVALCLVLGCGMSALAAESEYPIYVSGKEVKKAYSVVSDGTTYVAVGHVIRAMYPDAVATWENEQTVVRAEGLTVSAKPYSTYIVANGRYLYVPGGVRIHPETKDVLVPVRTVAKAMGAALSYDADGVYLEEGTGPILSGDAYYNAEDLDLIARVIYHEAGNQSLFGQIAVGNVILHRVASNVFPNTVAGVIYQPDQFTNATSMGSTPTSIIAAKLCLDGAEAAPCAYWFNRAGNWWSWAAQHKTYLYTIGGHAFYG